MAMNTKPTATNKSFRASGVEAMTSMAMLLCGTGKAGPRRFAASVVEAWFVTLVFTRFVAFASAIYLARRRPEYAPIAWLLGFAVLADVVRPALTILVLAPAREVSGLPYTGAARIAFHATTGLFVEWSAGIVAVALRVFLGRRPWAAALVYVVGSQRSPRATPSFVGRACSRPFSR